MTTLLTGATGFVGSAVARALLAAGHEVRALVRAGSDRRNLESLDVQLVEGDLTDAGSLREAAGGCESLIHVAADYRLWVPDPDRLYATNVDATRVLLRIARDAGVSRIVYTSSVATLGLVAGGVADEETPVSLDEMIGHYKRSKYLAEREVDRLVQEENVPAVIVNPSAPVGPRDIKPTPTGRTILDAAAGKMPVYVDTGLNVVHVDDVAQGHVLALQRGEIGRRYILGAENMTLKEILESVAALTGRTPPKIRLPHSLIIPVAQAAELWARLTGTEPLVTKDGARLARKRMFFSSARAERELGYSARPAAAALEDAVQWFQIHKYL